MSSQGLTGRHFFFGTLVAGAVPSAGFGSTVSLNTMGYKSPNEKLNLAAIGAGGQPFSDLKDAWAAQKLEFTNNRDANKWIKPTFRKGWEIKSHAILNLSCVTQTLVCSLEIP